MPLFRDIESAQAAAHKPFSLFGLKSLLVVSGTLATVVTLGFVSSRFSHTQDSGSTDMFILQDKGKVHSLNPSDSKLKSSFLFKIGDNSYMDRVQLSKDKKSLYFYDNRNFVFDFDTRTVEPVQSLPGYHNFDLLFKQPDLKTVLYGSFKSNEYKGIIRHYSVEELRVIEDFPTKCPVTRSPTVIGQSPDGSKVLYKCNGSHDYFLKNLDDTSSVDRFIITLERERSPKFMYSPLFSLDGSKLIFNTFESDHWTLINLKSDNPIAESKPVYFNANPENFQQFSLSDDMKKLYFVNKDENGMKLHEIDYNSLFEKDYSNPQKPLNIGQGRTIELGP